MEKSHSLSQIGVVAAFVVNSKKEITNSAAHFCQPSISILGVVVGMIFVFYTSFFQDSCSTFSTIFGGTNNHSCLQSVEVSED